LLAATLRFFCADLDIDGEGTTKPSTIWTPCCGIGD